MRRIFDRSRRTDNSRRSLSAHTKIRRAFAAVRLRTRAAFLAVVIAALFAQQGGRAEYQPAGEALPFRGGYLITGDYVVGNFDSCVSDVTGYK